MLEKVEETLGDLLKCARPAVLFEAMRHAVMGGGKRIRPQLCMAAAVAVGGRAEDALYPACAIELLHSYTLVHDDLPSMDNDAMRRGRPSVWAKYGEATAVLAGDALQALAFQTASRAPRNAGKILAALGDAAVGVVRGQVEDLFRQPPTGHQLPTAHLRQGFGATDQLSTTNYQLPTINYDFINRHKTADLFVAAAVMGAYAGGGEDVEAERLGAYALNLGLAFQHEDDLLDGDSPIPEDETKRKISDLTAAAVAALDGLPGDTTFLSALADRLAVRQA